VRSLAIRKRPPQGAGNWIIKAKTSCEKLNNKIEASPVSWITG
jgi:hypothetical protein